MNRSKDTPSGIKFEVAKTFVAAVSILGPIGVVASSAGASETKASTSHHHKTHKPKTPECSIINNVAVQQIEIGATKPSILKTLAKKLDTSVPTLLNKAIEAPVDCTPGLNSDEVMPSILVDAKTILPNCVALAYHATNNEATKPDTIYHDIFALCISTVAMPKPSTTTTAPISSTVA
jgi:hypothetical protein